MSYTYDSFKKALAIEMVVPNNDVTEPNFVAVLPTIIDYAEQRCYRELDLITASLTQIMPTAPNDRVFDVSTAPAYIVVVDRMRLLLPAGATIVNYTSAPPILPTSLDYLDAVYSGATPGPPMRFAMQNDEIAVLGPTPDKIYNIEVVGESRPVPLYNADPGDGTQMTFLTQVLPDLFLAAAMVSAAGYRKNYGAQADDPRMAVSWETQFQTLLSSAKTEENRKKFLGWGMMSSSTSPPVPAPAPAG